jgi:hypothetical protein
VNDEKLMLKYAMELEHVIVWVCGFVLEKSGSAFYSGGKKNTAVPAHALKA